MGKPIIYGIDGSPAVRAVLLTAHAIGLDYELHEIDPHKSEQKTEEFIRKNPQHTIPTLEDDGKCIWDSHAIITYLVSKYSKDDSLYPKDLYKRAVVDQRLHFESSVLSPRMIAFGASWKSNDPQNKENAKTAINEAFEFLEKFIGSNQYLAGASLTVADFSILATFSTINHYLPADPEKFPGLCNWFGRMTKLPYYQKANGEGLQKVIEYVNEMKSKQSAK
ncbi:unnamed protein product [Hermetia illucens]|uniref:Uncharacterized protein n=1 Tax=Hermetia illucens TaxID=343691 RepID=A0A7R8UMA7_HERIL|nr:inactive glutathione S-transferase D3-like [Hermetia illucens]CAD7083142.1 unnamed protein product [Hermetia illucens]